MTQNTNSAPFVETAMISTEEFARAIKCEPASIRKRYSMTGTYYGIRPTKLPNRRLLWSTNAVEQLMRG